MSLYAVAYVALLCLSAAVAGGMTVYAWRRRAEPGARPFAGMMAAVFVWIGCAAATLLTRDLGTHLFIERVQWVGIAFTPVFVMAFALSYTGYDEFVPSWTLGALSAFPLVTIGIVFSGQWRELLWENASVMVVQGVALSVEDFGILYYAFVIYVYAVVVVGAVLIVRLVFTSDYLFFDQAALLVVGVMTPVVGNAVTVVGLVPFRGFEVTPFAFTVTGLTFGYALFRRRLFELVPATRRLGRDTAIATLDDGVLILDSTYHVIYLNSEAADVLDCDPHEALGTPAADLVDTTAIDFDVPDALVELHTDDRFYEARNSVITDRRDREIGHTLVLHDITARKRRERRLREQRDELEHLDRLNEAIREVTQAFVSATSRTAIETIVCARLTASDIYTEASIIVDSADGIVAGDGGADAETEHAGTSVAIPAAKSDGGTVPVDPETLSDVLDTEHGSWVTVPLGYDQSIYGALVLYTTRSDAFESRERAVLGQFGDTVSQAINAVENRRLLLADTVTELEFRVPDAALAEVAKNADSRLSLAGLVPASDDEILVYCHTDSAERVVDAATGTEGVASTRTVDDADDVAEFVLPNRSALLVLSDGGANVRTAEATAEEYLVVVEVPPETDVRALTERVRESCPGTTLAAKHDLDRPAATGQHEGTLPEGALGELTDRQREVLEAAYRGGYFRWPRDRTAEEVAESISISSPTLHKHLRRAEEQLLEGMFDPDGDADRPRNPK